MIYTMPLCFHDKTTETLYTLVYKALVKGYLRCFHGSFDMMGNAFHLYSATSLQQPPMGWYKSGCRMEVTAMERLGEVKYTVKLHFGETKNWLL